MQQSGLYLLYKQAFHTHYRPLCQYACTFVKDTVYCEDIVQEIFLHIWEKKAELIGKEELRFYLYTAVRNRCLNHIKSIRKLAVNELTGQEQPPDAAGAPGGEPEVDFSVLVGEALERLPIKCREVFLLSRMGRLTYQQIADSSGISIKTVENQVGKALKIMRSFVREKKGFLIMLVIYICVCCRVG